MNNNDYIRYSTELNYLRKQLWQSYANILIDYLQHLKYKIKNNIPN